MDYHLILFGEFDELGKLGKLGELDELNSQFPMMNQPLVGNWTNQFSVKFEQERNGEK